MRAHLPTLKIAVLGTYELKLGNANLPIPHRGARRLLSYLAISLGPVDRSGLAQLLCPRQTLSDARAQLRQALFQVSSLYGRFGSPLEVNRQSVSWNPAYPVQVDASEFLSASTDDLPANLAAIALYRGAFLQGEEMNVKGTFEAWVLDQRHLCRFQLALRFDRAVATCREQGMLDTGAELAERWRGHFPLADDAHQATMNILIQSQKIPQALYLFEAFRERKVSRTGTKPGPAITALYEQLRQNLPAAPVPAMPLQDSVAQRHFATVLVVAAAPVTGRELDLLHHELLQNVLEPARSVAQTHEADLRITGAGYIELHFGISTPCPDGPQQATRAALALRELTANTAPPLQLGVHCGQVVAGANHPPIGALFGIARQIAEQQESRQGLLMSAAARSLLPPHPLGLQIHATGCWHAPGQESQTLYQIDRQSSYPRQQGMLIGRERELQQILAAAERVQTLGQGELVWVQGDAGMGKTLLLDHAATKLQSQISVIRFTCSPLQQYSVLHPLAAAFRRLLHLDELAVGQARRRVIRMLELLTKPDPLLQTLWLFWLGLHDPADAAHSDFAGMFRDYRHLLQESLLELLSSHLLPYRHVAIIEDLHWADAASLEVLEHFLFSLHQRPILTLISSRSGALLNTGLRAARQDILLRPWDRATSQSFLRQHLRQAPKPEIEQALLDAAGGIPPYLESLAISYREHGMQEIPGNLSIILEAFVARGGVALPTLQAAAVIGSPFPASDVEALQHRPAAELLPEIHILVERGLLVSDGEVWQFRHELLRQAVYAAILPARRRELHQRWAEQLVQRQYTELGVVAEHFSQAECWQEAGKYYLLASRRAQTMGSYQAAVVFAEAALRHLSSEDPERIELETIRYFSLRALYGYSAKPVIAAMEALDAACQARGRSGWTLLGVRFGQWIGASSLENSRAGLIAAQRLAQTDFGDIPEPAWRAVADYALGWTLFWRGQLVPARQHLQRVLHTWSEDWAASVLFATGERPLEAAMGYLGLIDILDGNATAGIRRFEEAIAHLTPDRHANMWLFMQVMFATMSLWTGQIWRTQRMVPEILTRSRSSGLIMWETFGHALQTWAEGRAGVIRPSTATTRLRARVREVEQIWRFGAGILHLLLVDIAYRGGHPHPFVLYRHAQHHLRQHGAAVFLPSLANLARRRTPHRTE